MPRKEREIRYALGRQLLQARRNLRKTIVTCAMEAGLKPPKYRMLELGTASPPSDDVLRRIAACLNLDFDALMILLDRVPEDIELKLRNALRLPGNARQIRHFLNNLPTSCIPEDSDKVAEVITDDEPDYLDKDYDLDIDL